MCQVYWLLTFHPRLFVVGRNHPSRTPDSVVSVCECVVVGGVVVRQPGALHLDPG